MSDSPSEPMPLEAVVGIITRECARLSHHSMDDLASNLICRIWLNGIEFEGPTNVRRYVWKGVRTHLMSAARRSYQRKMFSELLGEGEDRGPDWLDRLIAPVAAAQETTVEVKEIKKFGRTLPLIHRKVFLILADGGSMLDVSEELGLNPWDALRYLKEIRQYVETGNSLSDGKLALAAA